MQVSLYTKSGVFLAYVRVHGTPRVVTFGGKTYSSADAVWPATFRECDAEEGQPCSE